MLVVSDMAASRVCGAPVCSYRAVGMVEATMIEVLVLVRRYMVLGDANVQCGAVEQIVHSVSSREGTFHL